MLYLYFLRTFSSFTAITSPFQHVLNHNLISFLFNILDSTPRSRKIDKILAKFFQSFISPQIIAAAPIGFLFLKALHLSFQMHTRAFQMLHWAFQISVELITEASLKNLLYAFSMVANCVTRVGQ